MPHDLDEKALDQIAYAVLRSLDVKVSETHMAAVNEALSRAYPPAAKPAPEPSAEMVAGRTVRLPVTIGYASPAASFALAQTEGHSPSPLTIGSRLVVDGVEAVVAPVEPVARTIAMGTSVHSDGALATYRAMLSPEALGGR